MSPALRALCALCALCACARGEAGAGGAVGVDYCQQLRDLKLEQGNGSLVAERALSEQGKARRLRLAGGGAAPRAARDLLRALLVHALRYRDRDITLDDRSALADVVASKTRDEFMLSVATTWVNETAANVSCASRMCGVAGEWLSVVARGAAPVARRLLARGADVSCAQSWDELRADHCGFMHNTTHGYATSDRCQLSGCPDGTKCVTVVLGAEEDPAQECQRARALAAQFDVPTLRFAWLTDAKLRAWLHNSSRSFLFVDYDMWTDAAEEGVWPAPPPPPHAAPPPPPLPPVSVAVADTRLLTLFAPPILQLALLFRPSPAMLRQLLRDQVTLGAQQAACKSAVDFEKDVRGWFQCPEEYCNPTPTLLIYGCLGKEAYYDNIRSTVKNYWLSNFKLENESVPIIHFRHSRDCSDINEFLQAKIRNLTTRAQLHGVTAEGGAGAAVLTRTASLARVPLVLMSPETAHAPLGAGARSTAPPLTALVAAVQDLLNDCKWRRVALLREEGRCDKQKRSLGLGEALNDEDLVVWSHLVQAGNESSALSALLAQDARVVLVDASAQTAAGVLRAAQARALTPAAGYMWLVLGAATDAYGEDWRPNNTEFSYLSVSGAWRGGPAPEGLRGAAQLRRELCAALGDAWPAFAAPFADATLMLLEGTARLRRHRPQYLYDPQHPNTARLFFDLLNNISGVVHDIHGNVSPPVFTYRWTSARAEVVRVWGAPVERVGGAACGGVADRAVCHTTPSGDGFTQRCHDVAWAVLLCVLALGAPALVAAHAARRRRLRRRDRRVEERALLRSGHSAAEAAAAAALAEHMVARSALRLLDELGGGNYGVVRLAVLRREGGEALAVAAKTPRGDAPAGAAADLLREAALLATLRHERVVRFTGVCLEGGPLVLMEHAFHGDLRRYLRARRPLAERARAGFAEPEAAHVAAPALTRLAREAAAALAYLDRRRLVHRDVRAANCLVDAHRSLKLADFGMARRLGAATAGEYLCRRRAMFPVLWMAPESLAGGVFSTATDVWALGVLLLELATLGERPFGAWPAARVLRHVSGGGAPPLPRDAAPSTRGVAAACWHSEARERPSAAELVAYLAERPRAVQPALEPLPGTDADAGTGADAAADDAPPTPDSGLYIDEWTAS